MWSKNVPKKRRLSHFFSRSPLNRFRFRLHRSLSFRCVHLIVYLKSRFREKSWESWERGTPRFACTSRDVISCSILFAFRSSEVRFKEDIRAHITGLVFSVRRGVIRRRGRAFDRDGKIASSSCARNSSYSSLLYLLGGPGLSSSSRLHSLQRPPIAASNHSKTKTNHDLIHAPR